MRLKYLHYFGNDPMIVSWGHTALRHYYEG